MGNVHPVLAGALEGLREGLPAWDHYIVEELEKLLAGTDVLSARGLADQGARAREAGGVASTWQAMQCARRAMRGSGFYSERSQAWVREALDLVQDWCVRSDRLDAEAIERLRQLSDALGKELRGLKFEALDAMRWVRELVGDGRPGRPGGGALREAVERARWRRCRSLAVAAVSYTLSCVVDAVDEVQREGFAAQAVRTAFAALGADGLGHLVALSRRFEEVREVGDPEAIIDW